ncbi:MAG: hypothetical protein JWM68_853 [Verrucomicrobiales bacterium]|nr:hypothetical protein [Verrucomicrobiales bacterium]
MQSCPTKQFEQCQRVNVVRETQGSEKIIKIILERYDEKLGWYQSGALSLPLHQLPLLQQSLGEFSVADCHESCDGQNCPPKIICFPMLLAGLAATDAATAE